MSKVLVEALTPEEQQELLARIKALPSGPDISLITSETAVPLKITWKLITIIVALCMTVLGSVWWLANDRAEFARQLTSLREDLIVMAATNKDAITTTINELDATWQLRLQTTIAEVRATQKESDMDVRETFLRLESRIPKEFPPIRWLEDIYKRDINDLRKRIETLEKDVRTRSAVKETKVTQSVGPCF